MDEEYNSAKEKARKYYNALTSMICPALGFEISFPSKSFSHIKYMAKGNVRDMKSQIMRYKLLPLGIKLIGHTNTFQEYEEVAQQFSVVHNGSPMMKEANVMYWGLIAIIESRKVKVIIRKVGNGSPHFWSIVPAWTTNMRRDGKYVRMMKGDPNND
jgi:hypothetical protein